ncbi:MAG: tRNA (N6-isopentenyl adenosine(37)-C2)-methylthiotransferase MiaB [Planctomycetes bacterium]|nr:tRNA (N6-isopentenyl adenosine(37)-C2)-methylthiotransferase MiaB [Planctomycetota bacterium]
MSTTRVQSRCAEPVATGADEIPRRVHVVTFGCQMNKYDSLLAEGRFRRAGYATTDRLEEADVVLFNTCSVREHAEERTYSWLGELKRAKERRPDLVVGVMGCMAQRVGEEIFARAGHVDLVAGTRQFASLPALVGDVLAARAAGERARVVALGMEDDLVLDRGGEPWAGGGHAYLTVMRGCDLNCTYCIVPAVRGRVLSYPIEHLVREARGYVEAGVRAITLLGQTVNSYGEDAAAAGPGERRWSGRQGRPALADLLRALQEVEGLARIRLITGHPSYVSESLAEALRECDKVERFLPLPAQSGSDAVLRAMKRGYTTDLYRRRLDLLRARVPDVEISSDWIVGFPGESDEDFAASESFLAEQACAVNYVFKYSPRPGTSAAERLLDDVPEDVKKARNQRLLVAAERAGLARHAAHVGATRRVLVDAVSERGVGQVLGRSEHGLAVSLPGGAELVGRVVEARIESASAFGLAGQPLPAAARTT